MTEMMAGFPISKYGRFADAEIQTAQLAAFLAAADYHDYRMVYAAPIADRPSESYVVVEKRSILPRILNWLARH